MVKTAKQRVTRRAFISLLTALAVTPASALGGRSSTQGTRATITGHVFSKGTTVPKTLVGLWRSGVCYIITHTDHQGYFEFHWVKPGEYVVSAHGGGAKVVTVRDCNPHVGLFLV